MIKFVQIEDIFFSKKDMFTSNTGAAKSEVLNVAVGATGSGGVYDCIGTLVPASSLTQN